MELEAEWIEGITLSVVGMSKKESASKETTFQIASGGHRQHSGIAVGLNKGHAVTIRTPRTKPSNRCKSGAKYQLIRKVINNVAGFAPYEKRVIELIKGGGANGPKRAQRFCKRRLGSLRRAKKKIAYLSNVAEM